MLELTSNWCVAPEVLEKLAINVLKLAIITSYQFNSAGGVLLLASYYCMAATVANSSGESIPLHTSWIRWPLSFCMYVYQTMLCVCLCGMHKRSVLRSLHLKNSELLLWLFVVVCVILELVLFVALCPSWDRLFTYAFHVFACVLVGSFKCSCYVSCVCPSVSFWAHAFYLSNLLFWRCSPSYLQQQLSYVQVAMTSCISGTILVAIICLSSWTIHTCSGEALNAWHALD